MLKFKHGHLDLEARAFTHIYSERGAIILNLKYIDHHTNHWENIGLLLLSI